MKLLIPPEPILLKKQSNEQKDNAWDIDSLSLWFGNRPPTYLWNDAGWSTPLKEEGYNWQSFLKILSLHKKDMVRWMIGITQKGGKSLTGRDLESMDDETLFQEVRAVSIFARVSPQHKLKIVQQLSATRRGGCRDGRRGE